MAPTHKIATIQLYPKPMQIETNHKRACDYLRAAAAQGCALAVLPEYHLTNWVPKDPKFPALCADWRTYLRNYQNIAKELNMCVVPGTIVQTREGFDPERPASRLTRAAEREANTQHDKAHVRETEYEAEENGLENVAYFIDNRGEILGKYVKKNLWGPTERAHLQSSGRAEHPAFDTPLGKVGMLVCWDMAFPEAFRELIVQGAKLVVLPVFWTLSDCSDQGLKHNPTAEALFVDSTLVSRAFENTCAVVMSNAGGPPGRGYMGLSQIVTPFVGALSRLGSCAEGMAVADVDMQIIEDAEANYQVRADLARDDWHYDYRHDKSKL